MRAIFVGGGGGGGGLTIHSFCNTICPKLLPQAILKLAEGKGQGLCAHALAIHQKLMNRVPL